MTVLAGVPPVAGTPGAGWVGVEDLAGVVATESNVDLPAVVDAAADLMFRLSGEQFGTATDTVRPVRAGGGCGCGSIGGGDYVTFGWSSWSRWSCGCTGPSFVQLPAPVTAIGEVVVDGTVLTPTDDYVLLDGMYLVRVGANWPCCQNLALPSSEAGTWRVTFTHGPGIPAGGRIAARILAAELAKAAAGAECALSGRIQSVSRDGVSAVIVDSQDFLAQKRTGLAVPDLWLSSLGNLEGGTIYRPTRPGPNLLTQTAL